MGPETTTSPEISEQTVGSRIKHIRKSLKMTQKIFAESLGIVQGFLSAIEKGNKAPSDTLLIALQHLYRIKPEWLHSGEGEISLYSSLQPSSQTEGFAVIPLLNKLPADTGDFQTPACCDRYISLPDVPTDCVAVVYSGDYMSPTIRDSDVVVIKPVDNLVSGNIGLIVAKWREPLLRRYRLLKGEQYYSSDNSAYTSFHPDDTTKILGVVIKVWREIKI